ncbi:transposase [Streptomyces sp. NPDC059340]|uniref:transposase n=1 Tax=Streptomyces sp. NPDC059340 TaxID=3346806 RepID=UPI00369529A3
MPGVSVNRELRFALYQSHSGATVKQVAADLGVNPETLCDWVRAAGANRPRGRRAEATAKPSTPLEAENAALRKRVRELEEERETLVRDAGRNETDLEDRARVLRADIHTGGATRIQLQSQLQIAEDALGKLEGPVKAARGCSTCGLAGEGVPGRTWGRAGRFRNAYGELPWCGCGGSPRVIGS